MQQQFDYDYSDNELREWTDATIESMSRQATSGVIFFNNHFRGQAPRNAERMIELLTEQGVARIQNPPDPRKPPQNITEKN